MLWRDNCAVELRIMNLKKLVHKPQEVWLIVYFYQINVFIIIIYNWKFVKKKKIHCQSYGECNQFSSTELYIYHVYFTTLEITKNDT